MNEKDKTPLLAELLKRDHPPLVGNSGSYRILKPLGLAGATARVYLVNRDQDDRSFALKLMQPGLSVEMRKRFQDEMVNLQRLSRAEDSLGTRHIPRIVESSDLQQPITQELFRTLGSPFIIMDFAEGIDVNTLLMDKNVLSEAEALEIGKQFARVLYVIHSENLTYTDMKLDNLIWNVKTRHLTVIDWNVITENRLQEDAPKDRIKAAAYLYQMVTGVPIELDKAGLAVPNQRYRLLENFKNLSEGTRSFLIKAFHPDPSSRHGGGGPQLSCTKEFLKELEIHAERFKHSIHELIQKGKNALKERQWQEALEYLDLASRQADIEKDPAQFAELQEDREKAQDEANKLGRHAFLSGNGRYINGLFAEALEDFEKAMRDDPYDGEARLYAIAARFAINIGEENFREYKEPLEDCIRALREDHLDLAANTLKRLPGQAFDTSAVRSLQAEIKVRDAVRKGQRLLKEDKIDEAQEFFRSAYQKRDQILYVEPLEENLGSLTELYHKVEELKQLYQEGEAYLKEERFHEAAWVFWKARRISEGSKHANKRYQYAASLDAIKKLMDNGNLESAVGKCSQASIHFADEPMLKSLKTNVIEARCQQLRSLADKAYQSRRFDTAKEYILEILKWQPEDGAAKIKLEDIRQEISSGYKERIQELESKLRKKPSPAACEQAIRFIEEQGFQEFEEGRDCIKRTEELRESITSLSNELDDAISSGDMQAQLEVLNRAAAKNWVLKQGDPEQLKTGLRPKILEKDVDNIYTHLKYCRPQEAAVLCDNLLHTEISEDIKTIVAGLKEKANRLVSALRELKEIKERKTRLVGGSEDAESAELKLERDYLLILHQMKHIAPDLEAPAEIRQFKEKQADFLEKVGNFIERSRLHGHNCLSYHDFKSCREISFRFTEILSIFKEFAQDGRAEIEKWQNWSEEFNDLLILIEKEPPDRLADFSIMMKKLATLVRNPGLKKAILALDEAKLDESEPDQQVMEQLIFFTKDSPIAFWFHEILERELKIRALIKGHSDSLETLLKQLFDTREDYTLRLHLENKAKQEIEGLKEVDKKKAEQFENRLVDLLKQLLNVSDMDITSHEEQKRLNELQRRVCEKYQFESSVDINIMLTEYQQDNYFKGVIPRYKEQYTNVLYRLNKRNKCFTDVGLNELLDLREKYGEFPELNTAIQDTRKEIFRKKNKERFDKFAEKYDEARTQDDWQELHTELQAIEQALLSEPDRSRYLKMAEMIDNHLVIKAVLEPQNFNKYLAHKGDQMIEIWLRALEWNWKNRNRVDIPPLTVKNLEMGERNWLAQSELDVKSLQSLRWIKCLIQELEKLRSQAAPKRRVRSKQI